MHEGFPKYCLFFVSLYLPRSISFLSISSPLVGFEVLPFSHSKEKVNKKLKKHIVVIRLKCC